MRVRIDQPRQYVLPGRIDLGGPRLHARASRRTVPSERHWIERGHLGDHASLDDDVERALRRSTIAVDDGRIPDDQPLRPDAGDGRGLSKRGRCDGKRRDREVEGGAHGDYHPVPSGETQVWTANYGDGSRRLGHDPAFSLMASPIGPADKAGWTRPKFPTLDRDDVARVLQPWLGARRVVDARYLDGGLMNRNIRVDL